MAIEKELLDQLLEGRDPETVFTQDGLLDELKKGLSERVLNAELDAHLDAETADGKTNRHNGRSQKTVLTGTSKVTLDIPRDRAGTFDPQLIAKYQRRFPDFDQKIISMYARGMTVREIRGHLQELYGIEVSPDLISTVTDAVLEAVSEWQNRPLDACYAIVFFDAIRVKIRDEGFVRNKAVYIALAILPDGTKGLIDGHSINLSFQATYTVVWPGFGATDCHCFTLGCCFSFHVVQLEPVCWRRSTAKPNWPPSAPAWKIFRHRLIRPAARAVSFLLPTTS